MTIRSESLPKRTTIKRKAFVEDPTVFRKYQPIAEKVLCLVEQTDALHQRKAAWMIEHIQGDRLNMFTNPTGMTISSLARYIKRSTERLGRIEPDLIKEFIRIRAMPMSAKAIREGKLEYRRSEHGKAVALKYNQDYKDRNREEVNRKRRRYQRRPEARRRRREYNNRPEVKERQVQRFADYYIENREARKDYQRRRRSKRSVRLAIKRFRETHKKHRRELDLATKEFAHFGRMLSDPDPEKRYEGAIALGNRPDTWRYDSNLLELLENDTSPMVRMEAAWALGERKDWRAIPGLVRLGEWGAKERKDEAISAAIKALRKIRVSKAKEAAERLERLANPR